MFRRNWMALVLMGLAITAVLPGLAAADFLTTKDSADFDIKDWEMDTVPALMGGEASYWSADGSGIATLTEGVDGSYFGISSALPGTSWTVETRVQITDPSLDNSGPLGILLDDSASHRYVFDLTAAGVRDEQHGQSIIYNKDLTDEFHTIRIASDGTTVEIWIDGVAGILQAPVTLSGSSFSLLVGDFGSGSWNSGQIKIDYVRLDTTGGYAPIPEPTTAGLLVVGGLFVLKTKHRLQKS